MNVSAKKAENKIAEYLKVLGSPIRVQILLSIGYGEACVCHLEAVLKKRQAYISQHLMVMRDAGILDTRRDGKYIYYRVADANVFDLIHTSGQILDIPQGTLPVPSESTKLTQCECPHCQLSGKDLAIKERSMLEIKILGSGCPNCKKLEEETRKAVENLAEEAAFEKITDYQKIMEYDVLSTPGLVINGTVVSSGRVPSQREITSFLTSALE